MGGHRHPGGRRARSCSRRHCLARSAHVGTRESLDGFVIGASRGDELHRRGHADSVGPAICHWADATNRPMVGLIAEATIRGVAMSLTAAAAGGMVGAALWFTRRRPRTSIAGQSLARPLPAIIVVLRLRAAGTGRRLPGCRRQATGRPSGPGIGDDARLAGRPAHGAAARSARPDHTASRFLCENCAHVVPDMAFCPACGMATRASSRSSRSARRRSARFASDRFTGEARRRGSRPAHLARATRCPPGRTRRRRWASHIVSAAAAAVGRWLSACSSPGHPDV